MAWNPGPEVAAARDFGKKFDADRVVIIWATEAGQCGMASYGRTKTLCDQTKPVGVMLHRDAMEYFDNQRVDPRCSGSGIEPMEAPLCDRCNGSGFEPEEGG